MKLQDFDYSLPKELIAQYPLESRDEARLLVQDGNNEIINSHFYDLDKFLKEGDLLIFNDSKVVKACLTLNKDASSIHVNLNKPLTKTIWQGFAKPAKKLSIGDSFEFDGSHIIIKDKYEDGMIEFEFDLKSPLSVFDFLAIYGSMPIPPYIREGIADYEDEDNYQTIFCNEEGSVAAPTAGLHFSDHIFVELNKKNIDYSFITLHVGAGTFLPVKSENIEEHKMHSEYAEISEETAEKINQAKKDGRRIIAVGTTSMRTIEAAAINGNGIIEASQFETDIFIKPGFDFKITNGLITNFHLPKSTLLMLVSAFAGHKKTMEIYDYAVKNKYRFFSYGDGMLIIR